MSMGIDANRQPTKDAACMSSWVGRTRRKDGKASIPVKPAAAAAARKTLKNEQEEARQVGWVGRVCIGSDVRDHS